MIARYTLPALLYAALALSITACSRLESITSRATSTLIDPAITTEPAGEYGWNYYRSGALDLNRDGTEEKVVLATQVEMVRGRPAWNDGHVWQVYVEDAKGERTLVYAQRLQLGTLTLRLANDGAAPGIVLLEHLPDSLKIYEIDYKAPGDTSAHMAFKRRLDPRGQLASPRFPERIE